MMRYGHTTAETDMAVSSSRPSVSAEPGIQPMKPVCPGGAAKLGI